MSDPTPPTGSPASERRDLAATQPFTSVPQDLAATQPFTTTPQDLAATQPTNPGVTPPPGQHPQDLAATQPLTKTQPLEGTRSTVPPRPSGDPLTASPDFVATRLITDTPLRRDLDATRGTQVGDAQDDVATIARSTPNDQATIAFKPEQTSPFPSNAPSNPSSQPGGTRPTSPGDRTPLGTGSLLRTSFTQRVGRTKINSALNAESQTLDAKLQISRPSVLADLAASREGEALPPGVRRLIDEQGTEGRYAINRELAHGGMGAVLDISDHDFRRKAAMKVILARFARSPEAVERFLAEAQVTAQLEHPNIVPIHDLGVMEDGTLYFTMKMIEGQSLGKVVKTLQQDHGLLKLKDGDIAKPDAASKEAAAHWTEQEKLHVFLKVLDGVGFAHARGVIHRDIKPDNIMLGGHGEVLVVDWGIAKILGAPETLPTGDGLSMASPQTASHSRAPGATGVVSIRSEEASAATIAGSAMGTIYYMPPEQAQGALDEMDARSDIYALGATLYELLSLKRCLTGSSLAEMLVKIVEGQWISLSDADPTIHPDLVAIVHRSMARESKNRYQTCDEFGADLRRYLAGQAVAARKRSAGEIIRLWIAENRKRLIATAVAVVLMIAVAYGTVLALRNAAAKQDRATFEQIKNTFATQQPQELETLSGMLGTVRGLKSIQTEQPTKDMEDLLSEAVFNAKAVEKAKADAAAKASEYAEAMTRGQASLVQGGDLGLKEAESSFRQAYDLNPTAEARQGLSDTQQRIQSRQLELRTQAAQANAQDAAKSLDAAEGMAPLDPHMPGVLSAISRGLDLANVPGIKIDGLPALYDRFAQLKQRIHLADIAAHDLANANELAVKASAAMAANDINGAFGFARGALAFAPKEPQIQALYGQVTIAKASNDERQAERQRREDAESAATQLLASAQTALQQYNRSSADYLAAQETYRQLQESLGDQSLSDQKPVFEANQKAQQIQQVALAAVTTSEDQAQKVIALLEPWAHEKPIPESYRQAQGILATLYHQRLVAAIRANRTEEIAVYRGLLARADAYDHVYASDFSNTAQLEISAPAGTGPILARQLGAWDDTRLGPVGDAQTLSVGKAITLAQGSWQLISGATIMSVVLDPAHPTTITWPGAAPQLPGIPLFYVPGDLHRTVDGAPAGLKPFYLGATEVTNAQYLAFLKDPAIFAQIAKSYHHIAVKIQNGDNDHPLLYLVPAAQSNVTDFKAIPGSDPNTLADLVLDQAGPRQPVADITRDWAEAYCGWLSAKYHLRVRLPTAVEWRFAANGDDPQRVFPWGPHFNGNFCVSSGAKQTQAPADVGSNPYDVGPFGHRDLAGNLREWLADRRTTDIARDAGLHDAIIAAGSYDDDNARLFRSDYVESVDPSTRYPVIGFRILVEAP